MSPVSDPNDWKQKYRDSLRELEAEEQRYRRMEQALRRLVGRLCAAGMGADPKLDFELTALAAANRRNAPADELEQIALSLTSAVIAADAAPAPQPPLTHLQGPWIATCAAVERVLTELAATTLLEALPAAATDAELAAIVAQAADLLHERGDALARERQGSAALLSQVTLRLGEVAQYLTQSNDAARTGFEDSSELNDTVMQQFRGLSAAADSATDLGALQSLVSVRLEAVGRSLAEFRARDQARVQEHFGRSQRMRTRITELEHEARQLHGQLRVDPLTRLANRKSFEERLAQIALRHDLAAAPVSLLVWDIDDFKSINDRYGHRAGDRVLENVAACFSSGLRSEDFIARIGGEEFVVLLTGMTVDAALRVANELRAGIDALRFHFRGTRVQVSASCGVTELRAGDAEGAAFDRADAALYTAKREGKNRCVVG
jgi:diguanylate cyclase